MADRGHAVEHRVQLSIASIFANMKSISIRPIYPVGTDVNCPTIVLEAVRLAWIRNPLYCVAVLSLSVTATTSRVHSLHV
jgi:hypothetical protein